MASHEDKAFQQGLQRIETLIQTIQTAASPNVRASAEELVQTLLALHGAGIERMLDLVWESEASGGTLIDEVLAKDDLVSSLLLLHGLHPLDLETRVGQALDKVRPYLDSHGGDVELLGVEDGGVVRLRLQGSCDGCPSSQVTLKYAIEEGIYAAAPDVTAIEVEGVVERPLSMPNGIIPLTLISSTPAAPTAGTWVNVDGLATLGDGGLRVSDVSGVPVVFCNVGQTLVAYGTTCPSCGQALGTPTLAGKDLVCGRCGHRYDVLRAGRDLDEPRLHLDPIPLLAEQGSFKIAPPAPSGFWP